MIDGNTRREKIVNILRASDAAISATSLAAEFNVSRQIIVGDVALIRAQGIDINATPRGYVLASNDENIIRRTIVCCHSGEDMITELNTIVDFGCKVIDVIVEHPVYGQIVGQLQIASRYDVQQFVDRVKSQKAHSLSELTDGVHLHTIEVPSEDVYVKLVAKLDSLGVLFKD